MEDFKEELNLYEKCQIIPKLDHVFHYELYDKNPNIGFKVENRCFILFQDRSLKVVSQDELTKDSVSIYSTGDILFEKVYYLFIEYSQNSTTLVVQRLVSEIPQLSRMGMYLNNMWNYFSWALESIASAMISSSSSSSSCIWVAKKMRKEKKFLDVFYKSYDAVCKCDVIVNPKQKMRYKIAKFFDENQRHAIIIQGPKHAFILELSHRLFKSWYFNYPNIRYISDEDVKKKRLSFNIIEISAYELVQLAIRTVSKMGDFDIRTNNFQNFVQNYLCALGVENNENKLKFQ